MKQDRIPYHLYVRAFENAKWILTNKNSGEVTEYDYSEMSSIVIDAYISWHNGYLAKPPYNEAELNSQNVTIKYLHRGSCLIYRGGYVEDVDYSKILPDYTIDCYDWHYQCRHCNGVLDEIREKGQEAAKIVFCIRCFEETEYR